MEPTNLQVTSGAILLNLLGETVAVAQSDAGQRAFAEQLIIQPTAEIRVGDSTTIATTGTKVPADGVLGLTDEVTTSKGYALHKIFVLGVATVNIVAFDEFGNV